MVLREICRVPMGAFDEWRALCFKQPRVMNYVMMNMALVFILFAGKGVEKMCINTGHQAAYESKRRAQRFFMPYFLVSYKWRFPVNK